VNANGKTANVLHLEQFVEIELSRSLDFLTVATSDRSAGNVVAANRGELSAHRAFEEAQRLFRVLRGHICQIGARRLAIRIKKIGNALHEE